MPQLNKLRSAVPGGPHGDTAPSSLTRLRTALTVFFVVDGFLFAGWVVRIPAIKEQTGASPSALGLALLGVSAGGIVTMSLTGRLCRRFGNAPVVVASAALMSLSITLPPLMHSALTLGLVLLLFGGPYGALSVALNSAAVDLAAAQRRPLMPVFHGAFSLGGMVGAGLGALLAGGLSPTVHLALLALVGLGTTACAGPVLLRHPLPSPTRIERTSTRDRLTGRTRRLVLLCGAIALCTAYGEGAMADWGALHLEQGLGASPGVAALGYSLFAGTMTVGRLSGTLLLERFGPTPTLVASGTTAAVGMLLSALAPTVGWALAGFAVAGIGLANVFPVAVARAGTVAGPAGVAATSTLGYTGMLLGPPVIGFLTDWFSLPVALMTVAAACAGAAVIGYTARRPSSPAKTSRWVPASNS
ncbi:MFS transporter [Streptomyces sp. NBC_00690]|uniref:MFS transporter n=1 Tax=Streptomyces sp. NBC_00690 TaxID=2975808 RepID=UPI002E28C6C7|nr:MFS transporter [Streptomyces sp. NBC_00690]